MTDRRAYPCKNPKKRCSGDMWIHRTKKDDVFTMNCNKCDYSYTIAKPKEITNV
jgi:hypothetical protein